MIKNIFLVALRNFKRDKGYSLLNVLGLTIGVSFSLFLIFYIKDELSFDRYHAKAARISRIIAHIQERDKNLNWTSTQVPLGPTLKKDYPEVEEAGRFFYRERTMFKNGENRFFETKIYYADSTVFNIFSYKFIEGNAARALAEPRSIVISKTIAEKYFGKNTPALGKTLETVADLYKVTGVIEDVPANSHLRFDMLISASTILTGNQGGQDAWGGFNNFTYVLLKPGTSAAAFEKKLLPMYDRYMAAIFAKFNVKVQYGVQPITDIHLHSTLEGEPEELGSISYIWIFSAVAFFMLLIACINYMNLTTARSARRAKEIGIRKVTGSSREQLVAQFLTESLLTAFVAVLLSAGLVMLLLPLFNSISGKAFTLHTLLQPFNIGLLLAITLFTGLVGGSYPAFYLSSFMPVSILKGALSKASGNVNLRRSLVVVQFSISIIMLICTWVVYAQLHYVEKKDLGFSKDQVMTITVNTGKDERNKISGLNNDLRTLSSVKAVGTGNAYPGSPNISLNLFTVESKNGFVDKGVNCYSIDEHYINALGMQVVNGRNFSGASDTLHSILVNEAMVKYFSWDQPLGKRVKFPGDTSGNYLEVVGVIKDFNQKSLYNPIAPLLLFYGANNNVIQVKLNNGNVQSSIAKAETAWKKYFPQLPFEYKFLDADFNSQYAADQKRGKIFASFSILTVIITCLGLLGLIAFITQQRQKEISIRKIMGAGLAEIIPLVTKNFVLLVGIACLIAFPVAYLFMNRWLNLFPYNTGLRVTPFLLSAVTVLAITLLTVIFHTIKAAVANPAENLRTE